MEIPVLVEPLNGEGFRASTGAPLALSVEAPSEAEALRSLQATLQSRLAQGGRVVPLTVAEPTHPFAAFAGMFADDPDFRDVVAIMQERRGAEESGGDGT